MGVVSPRPPRLRLICIAFPSLANVLGVNVTIFRVPCPPSPAWVERAKMNATSSAWPASWVSGVDYCGPPSGPIFVACYSHPRMMPLEFIISSIFRVQALSANCLGPITLVHWRRHGLLNLITFTAAGTATADCTLTFHSHDSQFFLTRLRLRL